MMQKYLFSNLVFFFTLLSATAQITVDFTANRTEGCNFLQVTFNDLSSSTAGDIISWEWNLGGTNSRAQNPSRIFGSPGSYTICLRVTDDQGNSLEVCKDDFIVVYDTLTLNFNLSDTLLCAGDQVTIFDRSSSPNGNIVEWRWDVNGEIGSRIDQMPFDSFVNVYSEPGIYSLSMSLKDDKGCIGSVTQLDVLNVLGRPNPTVIPSSPTICNLPHSSSIFFSADSNFTYDWVFSNGVNYTGMNPPDITLTDYQSLDVIIYISNSGSCSDSMVINDLIVPNHIVSPQVDKFQACSEEAVRFLDLSLVPADSILWIFGDGETSDLANPTHRYSIGGTYDVSLGRLVNGCWIVQPLDSQVVILQSPIADYQSSVTLSCFPTNFISFTDQSVDAVSWDWQFGGTAEFGTSNDQNPMITFDEFGSYPVTLTVTAANGCQSSITKDTVRIFEFIPRISLPVQGCVPLNVTLEEESITLSPTNDWLWTISGDTNLIYSSKQIDFTFLDPGELDISLLVSNEAGCVDSVRLTNYILAGDVPTIAFDSNRIEVCVQDNIPFMDLSDSTINSWLWLFSDDTVSTEQNPTKSFGFPGYYNVTLQGRYNGCVGTRTIDSLVRVYEPLSRFGFTYSCSTREVTFENNSIGGDSLIWNFGVDTMTTDTSTLFSPIFSYPGPGRYEVSLTTFGEGGCQHTARDCLIIVAPIVDITMDDSDQCSPFRSEIINRSSGISDFNYLTPGGSTLGNAGNLFASYTAPGEYDPIVAIVTDFNGCMDTIQISDTIRVNGITGTLMPGSILCSRDSISLLHTANSQFGSVNTSTWRINNGDWIDFNSNSFLLDSAGTAMVDFAMSNEAGCVDTITEVFVINHVEAAFSSDSLGCTFSPTQFLNLSIGDTLSYSWKFGDGMTSNELNPRVQFLNEDMVSAELIIENLDGCKDSIIKVLNIIDPIPAFSIDSTFSFCPPFEGVFRNESQNSSRFVWDFGDETANSTQSEPIHIYTIPGTYNVSLTSGHVEGCELTSRFDDAVTIGGPDGFFRTTIIDPSSCSPVQTRFNANFDGIYNLIWDYGDGNFNVVEDAVITYSEFYFYQLTGVFVPTLILEDSLGCKIAFVDDTIRVDLLEADFDLSTDKICFNEQDLQIFNLSVTEDRSPTFNWSVFNNDTSFQYTTLEPLIDQLQPGQYSVRLIGQSGLCIDSLIKNNVLEVGELPQVQIETESLNNCEPHQVLFVDSTQLSLSTVVSRSWKDQNGSLLGNDVNLLQLFDSGLDTVYLRIETDVGCADSIFVEIVTLENVSAEIMDSTSFCLNEPGDLTAMLNQPDITGRARWIPDPELSCSDCLTTTATPLNDKYFYFEAQHNNGCVFLDSIYFQLKPDTMPRVAILPFDEVCQNTPIQLSIQGHREDYFYTWDTTGLGLNCYVDCFNPIATTTETTIYKFSVENVLGCQFQDSVLVSIIDPARGFAGPDQVICRGDEYQISIPFGEDALWHVSDGLSCAFCADPIASPNVSTDYLVSITDDQNCVAFDTLHIEVIEPSDLEAGRDTTICLGGRLELMGEGPGNLSWNSDLPILSDPNNPNITIAPPLSGYYYLNIDTGLCSVSDSIWIDVTESVNIEGLTVSACIGDTVLLNLSGAAEQLDWLDPAVVSVNATLGQIVIDESKQITVVGSVDNCISDTAFVNIVANEMPEFRLPNQITIFDQPIQLFLNNSPSISYTWLPPDGVSCQDCANPTIVSIPGVNGYQVIARDLFTGCQIVQDIRIVQLNECSSALVGVPNIFSPNLDGVNDEFKVITSLPQIDFLEVFDRWGNKLFRTVDKDIGWNGQFGSAIKQPGVYPYKLQFTCPSTNESILVRGDVTLIR